MGCCEQYMSFTYSKSTRNQAAVRVLNVLFAPAHEFAIVGD